MNVRTILAAVLVVLLAAPAGPGHSQPVRVKDLGKVSGWRENALIGYGLVTGLAGTGDSARSRATRQSLANVLSRFETAVSSDDIQSRNVAAVMLVASMPAHARAGDALDVTVSSVGDARSLVGGTLLLAPMKGPDGRVYVVAQGPLTVGGFRYDANNNQIQKNHPTVGMVPGGGVVEVAAFEGPRPSVETIHFVLHQADYTTAGRIADAVNGVLGSDLATVRDAAGIEIRVPEADRERVPNFVRRIEALAVVPDRRARVVINERTGTVVAGGDVRISSVAISHGDLRVTVTAETDVSQPVLLRSPGADVRTQVFTNSKLSVVESEGSRFVPAGSTTVADLVQSLAKLKTSTRDVIAILQAVRAAGALHAELIVQ